MVTNKTKECSQVLQLMDKDYSYSEAVKKVIEQNPKIDKTNLETELNNYI